MKQNPKIKNPQKQINQLSSKDVETLIVKKRKGPKSDSAWTKAKRGKHNSKQQVWGKYGQWSSSLKVNWCFSWKPMFNYELCEKG